MPYPLTQPILYQDPLAIFSIFANENGAVFLDSAQQMSSCGRYSYIGIDPFLTLRSKNNDIWLNEKSISGGNSFMVLQEQLNCFSLETHPTLPPFQGGVMGFFSYDLCQHLEKINRSQHDDMQFPDMLLGFYDLVMAFDHELKCAWIFSGGFHPSYSAEERCQWLMEKLENIPQKNTGSYFPRHDIQSHFSKESYEEAVRKVKEYILAGDIFEANISQRFSAELKVPPFELYQRLREINPAPFSAYLVFDDAIIASASPERFLKVENNHVETRPIKGTRPRGKTPSEDLALANDLLTSEKDHAENVMIVDLLRNDLSRVCEDHSVYVPQLCGLETYASVHHLVSVVTGKLKKSFHAIDLLKAAFPGGSITGAPKIRAMEIIAEIEPTPRGPYCGSMGYIGFNGAMDTSIIIRTFAIKNNKVTFQAGGAIVMDSDPSDEYAETLTKVGALRRILE